MAAGDTLGRALWPERLRVGIQSATQTDFRKNALWFTTLSGVERLMAMAQTVLISRALGITEYGVYGLIVGTIGFVASIVGFQMGLTATVFVSRYRQTEKARAARVISVVGTFAWCTAAGIAVAALPFAQPLSAFLIGSDQYTTVVMVGVVFVAATIVSGVQDGIAQGFEQFQTLAKLKIAVSMIVMAAVWPAAQRFGVSGVLVVTLCGLFLKCVILQRTIARSRRDDGIPPTGSGVTFRELIGNFAFPSMVVSLLVGFATWMGLFLLSRLDGGFDQVAIVSTGLQWRTPVLLLTTAVGSVAVPAFSRMSSSGDATGARGLRRRLLAVNFAVSSVAALLTVAGSGVIMALYGQGFASGRTAFCAIALSTIPTVLANVYMQELVGAARMWRQLWLHGAYIVALCVSFVVLVPRYHALGYAVSLLIGAVAFLAQAMVSDGPAGPRSLGRGAL